MANAADIIVNLVAKTGRLEKGMRKGKRSLQGLERSAKSVQKALRFAGGALAVFGGAAIAQGIRGQLRFASALDRVVDTVGFTVEEVQALRFASEQLDLDIRQLDIGLQRFSRRVGEVAQGQGELLKISELYNISIRDTDGNMRSNIELLRQFANVVKDAESEQEQLRIAFKLFDTEGAVLVRLLREGGEGIDKFVRRAQQLGIVLKGSVVKEASAADAQLRAIASVMQAKLLVAVTNNIGPMRDLAEGMGSLGVASIEAAAGLIAVVKTVGVGLGERIAQIFSGADTPAGRISEMRDRIKELQEQIARGAGGESNRFNVFAPGQLEKDRQELAQLLALQKAFFDNRKTEVEAQLALAEATINANIAVAESVDHIDIAEVSVEATLARQFIFLQRRQRLAQLIEASRSRESRILEDIAFINREIRETEGNTNELLRVREGLYEDLLDTIDSSSEKVTELEEFGVQAARNMQTAMANFISGSEQGFDNMLKSFTKMLIQMVAELLARQLLLQFFSAFSGSSSSFGAFAAGAAGSLETRHSGGPLAAGQAALIQPNREIFVPNVAGRIQHGQAGQAITVINNITVNGADPARTIELLTPLLEQNRERTKAEMFELRNRGRF